MTAEIEIMNTNRRVLILDDDQISTAALAKRLGRRGFDVHVLNSPTGIVEYVQTNKIELVVLDIIMPEMNGLEVLEMLRKNFTKAELPIIMLTAIDDSLEIIDSFKLGANDFIAKPANVDVATARFMAHLSTVDLHREHLIKNELAAINALIITYHHEINNPLTIANAALHMLDNSKEINDDKTIEKISNALKRITNIVKKISEIHQSKSVQYETYIGDRKMIKLK